MSSSSEAGPSKTTPDLSLNIPLHVKYIQNLDKNKDLAYHLTAHIRLNGVYWGLTALEIMGQADALDRDEMIEYVLSCWDDEAGAFGAHTEHDAHIHATLSAIQILVMQDALGRADVDRLETFLLDRVQPDGSVTGDSFGETDTRFTHILLLALTLLGRLDSLRALYNDKGLDLVVDNVRRSMNFDGAFGSRPGAESHGAQVWVCVGSLALADRLDIVDPNTLGWWLSERQVPSGGLNGRPEKLPDVCYSWWNLASLSIIGKLHWIDRDKLIEFILESQDLDYGGIADRPGDWVDVFHTVFGLAGLSLVGFPGLQDIDPVFCMPAKLIDKLGLRKTYTTLPRMDDKYPTS
ncbi:terpenoid cyclases/protein prenyltransferase alpha-alpha toroid [Kockovaella imperatae]|uniref:Geranylgeranyl transferase type-2 subunit beta n=1 Tax=Kockovaella imperatae TaxID=4999 RepID=A0A1Y1UQF1_9TREE|nr:terpenoid cyclases/protein prenyltransferase alpha-alpha toroid [Kockovaella imperatae]ORX40263.1 terpenoid cyclases/protein prenyltransferase alpha-alpha toroid [Kockovaella imperatae]